MIKVAVENSLKSSCLLPLAKYLEMKQIVAKVEKKCISIVWKAYIKWETSI